MTDRKKNTLLEGSVLLTILVLCAAITPAMVSQTFSATPQERTNMALSEGLAARFLNQFGYKSPEPLQYVATSASGATTGTGLYNVADNGKQTTVNVESNLQIQNGLTTGYNYAAKFTADTGKYYSVTENCVKVRNSNIVTTISSEEIRGSLTLSSYVTEQKTIGAVVDKKIDGTLKFSNSSGRSYKVDFHMVGTWTSNESTIIAAKTIVDQDVMAPFGHYVVNLSPSPNGLGAKADITLPNGTVVDPGIEQILNSPAGNGWIYGWDIWWEPGFGWILAGELLVLGVEITIIAPEFGWMIDAMDALMWIGGAYTSDMSDITIMYFDIVLYWGIIPYYAEAGFCTDRIIDLQTLYWQTLDAWYYIPLIGGSEWHIDPFPPIGYW